MPGPVTPMFEMTLVHEDPLTPDLQGVSCNAAGAGWDEKEVGLGMMLASGQEGDHR